MLILVGVTINVALNGGLFSKAEEATTKTKIEQIQETLTIKKVEVLAEYDGKVPEDYGITIDSLNLPTELKTEYGSKLIISKDAKLYYDASVVTDLETQKLLESMGIKAYVNDQEGGNNEPGENETIGEEKSFTLNELGEYEEGADSLILFNIEKAREVIETDLSQYLLYNNWYIAIESDDEQFDGFVQVFLAGEDIKESAQILITAFIDGDTFGIGVYTSEANDLISKTPKEGQLTHKEFINLYGDVEFRIIDPSSIKLPTE